MLKSFSILIGFGIILQSCKGSDSGFAPSPALTPVYQEFNAIETNSQRVTTANGWTIDENHNDFVQKKTLSNGWEVHAQYE